MLKQTVIFIGFVLLSAVVFLQAQELALAYFVFFPMLYLSLLYFLLEEGHPRFMQASIAIFSILYVYYFIEFRTIEIVILGLLFLAFSVALTIYKRNHLASLQGNILQTDRLRQELETLNQKHHSRLDSLHHLEKQVSSLVDLFEIARDFSDTLSWDTLAELLYKKITPEIAFTSLRLILVRYADLPAPTSDLQKSFKISKAGLDASLTPLTQQELSGIQQLRETHQMHKVDHEWYFPLLADDSVQALFIVAGAEQSDLAKFEVLAAHLILQSKKIKLYETVRELSIIDGLTGVYVRRHFLERFDDELQRCHKYGLPLALLMLDIDHFKRYNDDFGHLVGDATLREVAGLLRHSLRNVDIVSRYGGEEFVVVIPEAKLENACEVAERIRSNIARHHFQLYEVQTRVTVSVGVCVFPEDVSNIPEEKNNEIPFEIVRRADKALYRAKEEGRNRVICYRDL